MINNCWKCKFASEPFRLPDGNHVMCQHPRYNVKEGQEPLDYNELKRVTCLK